MVRAGHLDNYKAAACRSAGPLSAGGAPQPLLCVTVALALPPLLCVTVVTTVTSLPSPTALFGTWCLTETVSSSAETRVRTCPSADDARVALSPLPPPRATPRSAFP